MHNQTGLIETAEIATAAWIDGRLITPDNIYLKVVDNKIKNAQSKLVSKLENKFNEGKKGNGISFLMKKGMTLKYSRKLKILMSCTLP